MAQDFTTTALLASIKRRGMLPSNSNSLATSDFLAVATEEMQSYVMNLLLGAREEYKVADYDVSVTSGVVRIPSRASGDMLRDVLFSGDGVDFQPLRRIEPERAHEYGTSGSQPVGFYFQDQDVILVPAPTTGTLRLKHHRRPSQLVATSAVATISSINGDRTVITTTGSIPGTMTSGVTLDIVDNTPGFKLLVMDAATTGTVSGTTVTLSTALPASVAAGDYVCLAGESPVPQVPVELHPLLAQRTAGVCLKLLGDPKADGALALAETMRKDALVQLTPRSKGSARPLINRNGPGWNYRNRR